MLEVEELSKSFSTAAGRVPVLEGVCFRLEPGGRMAIMGPSGSGKSTLLSIIGALEEPTAGRVRLDGTDPFAGDAAARAAFRNRRIGFVFQEHALLAGCTALITCWCRRWPPAVFPARRSPAAPGSSSGSASAGGSITAPESSPAASGSGWPSPGRSCLRPA